MIGRSAGQLHDWRISTGWLLESLKECTTEKYSRFVSLACVNSASVHFVHFTIIASLPSADIYYWQTLHITPGLAVHMVVECSISISDTASVGERSSTSWASRSEIVTG